MIRNNNISDLLKQLTKTTNDSVKSVICVVREVFIDSFLITAEPIDTEDFDLTTGNSINYIYDVRLTAFDPVDIDQIGHLLIPKIGSYVIVSFIENGDKFVSMYSQIESFQAYTEIGASLTLTEIDSKGNSVLIADENSIVGNDISYIGDGDGENYIKIENDTAKITILTDGEMATQTNGNTLINAQSGDISINALDGVAVLTASKEAVIKGSKIFIYNDITDLKTILSDLITTLNTNAVPDLSLVAPYGAGTGVALAADLVTLQTKINALLV